MDRYRFSENVAAQRMQQSFVLIRSAPWNKDFDKDTTAQRKNAIRGTGSECRSGAGAALLYKRETAGDVSRETSPAVSLL